MYKTNGIYVNTCMFVRPYVWSDLTLVCMYMRPILFFLACFLSFLPSTDALHPGPQKPNKTKKKRENRECTHICAFYGTQRRSSGGGSYEQGVKTKRTESKRAYKSALFVG